VQIADFEQLLNRRIEKLKSTLLTKRAEYAQGRDDVLHNLKQGAAFLRCTPQECLLAYVTKHLVSIADLVQSGQPVPEAVADEKLGDAIVYMVLLEAIWNEGRNTGL